MHRSAWKGYSPKFKFVSNGVLRSSDSLSPLSLGCSDLLASVQIIPQARLMAPSYAKPMGLHVSAAASPHGAECHRYGCSNQHLADIEH